MAKSDIFRQLAVQCSTHEYPIYIGSHLLRDEELLVRHVRAEQVLIVTNQTVAPLYLLGVQNAFCEKQCNTVVLADGESYKNQDSLTTIYDALIKHHHHRDTTLVALGGGVIGDITGFAAATYQRGVHYIQLPTTLLAEVDASVGGKTAINHPHGKNMIGSFHPPQAVLMDLQTLATLPEREFRAGFAEVLKYGLLVGGDFLSGLTTLLSKNVRDIPLNELAHLVGQCCEIKSQFVQEDERETGCRALLNLGHTFAHALEAYTHYQRWLHGEAVAIGLYCVALLSHQLGYLDAKSLASVDLLLRALQLPRRIPKGLDLEQLHSLMFNDKKIKNKAIHFVLMRAFGDCYLDSRVTEEQVRHLLISAVEGEEQ